MGNNLEKTIVEYESGNTTVKLSPAIVRNYLVNGNAHVTNEEIVMFIQLCRAQRLNPFIREAYLIKFKDRPATMVTGKDVFTKRASNHPKFGGLEAGIILADTSGKMEYRPGSVVLIGENLVGGWARVHINGYTVPMESSVSMQEYCSYDRDGKPTRSWLKMPGTMIRKVAIVQALREAFPCELQGCYDASEMKIEPDALDTKHVEFLPPDDDDDGSTRSVDPNTGEVIEYE